MGVPAKLSGYSGLTLFVPVTESVVNKLVPMQTLLIERRPSVKLIPLENVEVALPSSVRPPTKVEVAGLGHSVMHDAAIQYPESDPMDAAQMPPAFTCEAMPYLRLLTSVRALVRPCRRGRCI